MRPMRLHGLDLARFLAFAGMVIVNFKIAMGAENDGGAASIFTSMFEGRAAATFVLLAGIGLGLGFQRYGMQPLLTLRRAMFLLVVGMLNSLIFDADILHYYAFYFLVGLCLLRFRDRSLFIVIAALNVCFVVMLLMLNYDQGWNWEAYSYRDFWTPVGFVRNLFFNGWHPVIPWASFLVLGIWVARLRLAERSVQIKLCLGGSGIMLAAELISIVSIATVGDGSEISVFFATAPVPPTPFYVLAGGGAAMMVTGFSLLVGSSTIAKAFLPAGRQALTLYIAHILVGMGTLEALNMLDGQTAQAALNASLLFVLASAIYAFVWSKFFSRGPLEAVMRKIAG